MDSDKRPIFKVMDPLPPDDKGYCYLHTEHFDMYLQGAARHLIPKHGSLIDRIPHLGLFAFIAVSVSTPLAIVLKLNMWLAIAMVILFSLIMFLYIFRIKRFVKRIIKHHMCFECGYSLELTPTYEDGYGKCSECGKQFHFGYYCHVPYIYKRRLTNDEKTNQAN